jgi:hypothetical protein
MPTGIPPAEVDATALEAGPRERDGGRCERTVASALTKAEATSFPAPLKERRGATFGP